ncbi:uncharacterized protein LOC128886497 isoform X1 [Hylaeus anthracinus]|uniref:uncharacterized protein LOC128886497 isoform X1 n=2 Tax=Hylaeus anthracinus TaxID=313031 RepID=UPI0023B8FFF6|nr:uncharacterized protein LOC128886497 isoform X1 [Hylaeus anthracinus]
MIRNITPEKAIAFTRLSVALNAYWPPSPTATRIQVLRFKVYRFIAMLSVGMQLFPLSYSIYVNIKVDTFTVTKVTCFTSAVVHIFGQSILSYIHYDRIQAIIAQMTDFCAKAKSQERSVLQRYVDKYSTFYMVAVFWFYMTSVLFVLGTLLLDQPFPTDAAYPFDVDYEPLRTIIFLHQSYVCMQNSAMTSSNAYVALLVLFAAARLETLMLELRDVHDCEALIRCIKKYYSVKRYAQEVVDVTRCTALLTVILTSIPLVLCGVNIISKQPVMIKVQFIFMAGTAFLEVFMCVWPADVMLDVSSNAIQKVYESTWYAQIAKMQKMVLLALLPQKPLTISLGCIVPVLSLNFYCSYVSNAFSIFTVLRLVLNEHAES